MLGYIQKPGDPAQGGRKSQGDKPNILMESPSIPDLCLTEPDMSLIQCNCQSESWSDWHLSLLTEASTKTHVDETKCVEERGRTKLPIKDTEDQLWIWFDHLLQSRICQIQSIWFRFDWFQSNRLNPLIYNFGFAPLFTNLLIKIINKWFLGLSDLSDEKSLKTRK